MIFCKCLSLLPCLLVKKNEIGQRLMKLWKLETRVLLAYFLNHPVCHIHHCRQGWGVTKYKYFVTILRYFFEYFVM